MPSGCHCGQLKCQTLSGCVATSGCGVRNRRSDPSGCTEYTPPSSSSEVAPSLTNAMRWPPGDHLGSLMDEPGTGTCCKSLPSGRMVNSPVNGAMPLTICTLRITATRGSPLGGVPPTVRFGDVAAVVRTPSVTSTLSSRGLPARWSPTVQVNCVPWTSMAMGLNDSPPSVEYDNAARISSVGVPSSSLAVQRMSSSPPMATHVLAVGEVNSTVGAAALTARSTSTEPVATSRSTRRAAPSTHGTRAPNEDQPTRPSPR